MFGGECVIRASKRRPEKRVALSTVLEAVVLKTVFLEVFFREKGSDIHKIRRQGVGKKGLQGMV